MLPSGQLANSCGSYPLHESDPPKNAPDNIVLVNSYHSSTTAKIKEFPSHEKKRTREQTIDLVACYRRE